MKQITQQFPDKEDTMQEVLIVGIIFGSLIMLIKLLSDNRLRHKLIDKGMLDENVKFLYRESPQHRIISSLKWGFVLIGIGLAFLLAQTVPVHQQEEVTIGSMFLLAGIGFLAYYFVADHYLKKNNPDR